MPVPTLPAGEGRGDDMRIVKQGKVPNKWFRAECQHCATVVDFQASEAQVEMGRFDSRARYFVSCPTCGLRILGDQIAKKKAGVA